MRIGLEKLTLFLMKIDFSHLLVDIEGNILKDFKNPGDTDESEVLLGDICKKALLATHVARGVPEERDEVKKLEHAMLAQRIVREKKFDLTAEEVVLLKKRIGFFFNPEVVLSTTNLLDPKEVDSKGK